MVNITKTDWRAFIELTPVNVTEEGTAIETGGIIYFDITKRPIIVQDQSCTILHLPQEITLTVKEPVKDILAAVDKLIADEQEKKAKEAEEYYKATQARVLETQKALEGSK